MYKTLTADDEFPDCLKCENTNCNCVKHCGAKMGWNGYYRTVNLDRLNEDSVED